MKQFSYTIRDPLGIHARPAGLLARAAGKYGDTEIMIDRNGESVRATRLMKLMSLGVKQGDQITVSAEGASEESAILEMQKFFSDHL